MIYTSMRAKQFKSIGFLLLFLSGCARVPDSDLAHLSDPIPLDQSLELALERESSKKGAGQMIAGGRCSQIRS